MAVCLQAARALRCRRFLPSVPLSSVLRARVLGLGVCGGWLGQDSHPRQSDRLLCESKSTDAWTNGLVRVCRRTRRWRLAHPRAAIASHGTRAHGEYDRGVPVRRGRSRSPFFRLHRPGQIFRCDALRVSFCLARDTHFRTGKILGRLVDDAQASRIASNVKRDAARPLLPVKREQIVKPTLGQIFGLSLLGLAIILAVLFYI